MRGRPARPGPARRRDHVGRPLARRAVGPEARRPERPGPLGRRLRRAMGQLVAGTARSCRPRAGCEGRPRRRAGRDTGAAAGRPAQRLPDHVRHRKRSGGAWRPSPGAIYPALSQLADEGLIVGEESSGRRVFRLTDEGRQYIEENPGAARGAWESQEQQEAWQLPGPFAVAARLGGGIVQVAHAGTPDQVRAAERLLEQTRRRLYQILADDESGEPDEDDEQ